MKTAPGVLPRASIARQLGLIGTLKAFKRRAVVLAIVCLLTGAAYVLCRTVILPALQARAERVQSQHDQFLAECEMIGGSFLQKTYPDGRFAHPVAACLDYEGYVLLSHVLDAALLR